MFSEGYLLILIDLLLLVPLGSLGVKVYRNLFFYLILKQVDGWCVICLRLSFAVFGHLSLG